MMDIKTLLEDEIDILYTTLDRLKIYDIRLSHTKDGRIFAKDADSQWTGKNFYKFLLNDAIVYNQDGTSSVLTEHTLTSLRQLGKHYGAAFPFMELEENPIKYAEMSMEQNYNMIDGIINNISVQEETAKKEEPVTANEVLKQKSETPLLRVVPVNRFERYIEPGEITQDQYIVKGGILLTPCASNPDFYESSNITRMDNVLEGMRDNLKQHQTVLGNLLQQMEDAKVEVKRPFPQEAELAEKSERLAALNVALNIGGKDKPNSRERQKHDGKTSIKRLLRRMGVESAASAAPKKDKEMEVAI